jgi:hypothetical protein
MRGSRLLTTSSAGEAGLFCGTAWWKTGIGWVTEYEVLTENMQMGRGRRERLGSPAWNGSAWCYGDIMEREHLFPSLLRYWEASIVCQRGTWCSKALTGTGWAGLGRSSRHS